MSKNPFTEAIEAGADDLHEGPYSDKPRGYVTVPAVGPGTQPKKRFNYRFEEDTFVTFQPWGECVFCRKRMEAKKIEDTGAAYECTHTRRKEYIALREKMLADGYMEVSSKRQVLPNGVVIVSIEWLVPLEPAESFRPQKKTPQRL